MKTIDKLMNMDRQRFMGYLFIVIALLMVIQGLWLSHKQDAEASCQAAYNNQVSTVVAQRGQWADEDRAALNTMIFEVINPSVDDHERQQAVIDYAATARKNDANRQANPLPERTSCG